MSEQKKKEKPNLTWDKANETFSEYMARVKKHLSGMSKELTLEQESNLRVAAKSIVREIMGKKKEGASEEPQRSDFPPGVAGDLQFKTAYKKWLEKIS